MNIRFGSCLVAVPNVSVCTILTCWRTFQVVDADPNVAAMSHRVGHWLLSYQSSRFQVELIQEFGGICETVCVN